MSWIILLVSGKQFQGCVSWDHKQRQIAEEVEYKNGCEVTKREGSATILLSCSTSRWLLSCLRGVQRMERGFEGRYSIAW